MWYVYEIVGDKAGCVRDDRFDTRQKKQEERGEMIIRSTHSCIYEASDAEIALQKLKGYKVDPIPYHETVRRGLIGTQNAKHVKRNINLEGCSKGGKVSGRNAVESGQLQSITSLGGKASAASPNASYKQKRTCPHCGYESTPCGVAAHIRWNH